MLRLSFITAEWDAVHEINDDFLAIIEKMQTYPYGFTQEFKAKFLTMIRKNKGQKCLISANWIISPLSPNGVYLRKIVGLLNEGLTLEAAKIKLKTNKH